MVTSWTRTSLVPTSDTPDNGGVIRELLHMTQFGAVHDVCCVEEGGQYNPLGCSRATGHNVRCDGPQAAKLRSVGEVICDPSDKQWVHLHGGEFFLQARRLYGVKGAGEIYKKNSHSAAFPVEVSDGTLQEMQHSVLNPHIILIAELKWILGFATGMMQDVFSRESGPSPGEGSC